MVAVQEIWRYQGGTSSWDAIHGAAALSDGSFVVAGLTHGEWNGSNAGGGDLVAYKISSEGTFQWAWQEGYSQDDEIRAVVALDDDSVVVAGFVDGVESSTGFDFVAERFCSNGTTQWSWRDGTDGNDFMYAAAVTTDGNIVLAGYTSGAWNGTSTGLYVIAAVKLNADGTEIWRWQGTGGSANVFILASAARPDGSVVLAGYTRGSWYVALSPEATTDFIAIALDEKGGELWRWQNGTSGINALLAVTALDDGSVVLAGYTTGNWSGINHGERDFAAVKLDVDGVEEWRWQNGSSEDDKCRTATLGTDGSIILAGQVGGDWERTIEGEEDFAAIGLDADGVEVLWTYQEGTSWSDQINVATARSDGAVLLAGKTSGSWAIADADKSSDFAAVLLTVGAPPPTVLPSLVPSSALTSSTPNTLPPTTLERVTAPPSLPRSTRELVTAPPARPPTTLEPVTAPPSATLSSGSSTGFTPAVIGAVLAVASLPAVIAVCIFRRGNAMRRVGSHTAAEDEPACYRQAVNPTPTAMGTVGSHAPAGEEPVCYPQAVTPTPKSMGTVGSHAPAEDEPACYPQVVIPTPKAMKTVDSHVPAGEEPVCYPQAVTPTPKSMGTVGSHAPAEDEPASYPQVVIPTPKAMKTVDSHVPAGEEPEFFPQVMTPTGRSPPPYAASSSYDAATLRA